MIYLKTQIAAQDNELILCALIWTNLNSTECRKSSYAMIAASAI